MSGPRVLRTNPQSSTFLPGYQEDRLKSWMDADPRFRETWFRQRLDLHDQSQESYDFALACFGLGIGLSEQEIVDLIVHHRDQHKQKQRSRADYFQRLISKATACTSSRDDLGKATGPTSESDSPEPLPGSGSPPESPSSPGPRATPPPDEAAKKAKMRQDLSRVLGVQIKNITKICGQSPIYEVELAQGKVTFYNISKFLSQACVRYELAKVTGKLIRQFTRAEWHRIRITLLEACTDKEGGEEMDTEGNARLRLDQYLLARRFIESVEGQTRDDARVPMVIGGSITVCANDILAFINKSGTENATIPDVVGMLHAVGAESKPHHGKCNEQSRWFLPPEKFAATDYRDAPPEESHETR